MAGNREDKGCRCSFCKKNQNQVRKLISGPGDVFICDECIEVCNEILAEQIYDDEPSKGTFTDNKRRWNQIHTGVSRFPASQEAS